MNIIKEDKVNIVKTYVSGEISTEMKSSDIGVSIATIRRWISRYESIGGKAFDDKQRNKTYTKKFKEKVDQSMLKW